MTFVTQDMYRSLVRNKDLKLMIIIQRDPAPRYEALFLSTEHESTSDGRRIEKLVERIMKKFEQ